MPSVTAFEDALESPAVRGFLHTPEAASGEGLVLTHGAGSNAGAPQLAAIGEAFAAAGIMVLRCDLPFRQARPKGSPYPAGAAQDRAGLARAVRLLRARCSGRVFLGGHSYGGRQASMVAAEQAALADGLLLLSYPLHPPGRPESLRTAHFPQLATPAVFLHGTRDPFGSIEEMRAALELIRARHELIVIERAGHDLGGKANGAKVAALALSGLGSIC